MPKKIAFMGKRETKEDDDIRSLDPSSTGWIYLWSQQQETINIAENKMASEELNGGGSLLLVAVLLVVEAAAAAEVVREGATVGPGYVRWFFHAQNKVVVKYTLTLSHCRMGGEREFPHSILEKIHQVIFFVPRQSRRSVRPATPSPWRDTRVAALRQVANCSIYIVAMQW